MWLVCFLVINFFKVSSQSPVIDGVKESIWDNANYFVPAKLAKNSMGDSGPDNADLSGKFWTLWDSANLYIFVEITDDVVSNTGGEKIHHNDNIELYLDINNSKYTQYDEVDDDQLRFLPGLTTMTSKRGVEAGDLEYESVIGGNGYTYEFRLPWDSLTADTFNAHAGREIGFDFLLTDNDAGSTKDYILSWNTPENDAWSDPSVFGTMKLLASGTTEKVISQNQPAEHDEYQIDEANITATIHVDVNDPAANDTNNGSVGSPFKTIQAALDAAADSAGKGVATKVSIANGIYREDGLIMFRTGNAYKFMNTEVVIEGEQKDSVIITGAERWNTGWTNHDVRTYKHDWPYKITVEKPWGDKGPDAEIASRREMIFVDDVWMKQVMSLGELENNTFYVEDSNYIYVKVADSIDFNNANKEVSLRGDGVDAPWPPSRLFVIPSDKDKVVLRNLTFKHANMRLSEATIKIKGWKVLMEDCNVLWNNGLGVSISDSSRYISLKNNVIDHNGGAGITTWTTFQLSLDGNSTSYNNWRGHLGDYHSHAIGGIKFHYTTNATITNHLAKDNWCSGLWTDLDINDFTFENCIVEGNYGPGLLIEISENIHFTNCTIERNVPGVRIHSSHDVYIDSSYFKGNAIHFAVYKDHRDFSSTEWQNNLNKIWDKTPYNWNITNSTIEAINDSVWQSTAEQRIPHWMSYTNPGYQPFWHFSKNDYMSTLFGRATIAYQNNEWIHYKDKPFRDDQGNQLSTSEWEEWISGFASGAKAIAIIDSFAQNNNADSLDIALLTSAGAENIIDSNLAFYQTIIEDKSDISGLNSLQNTIDQANAFAQIVRMAENNDASGLTAQILFEAGVLYRTDRLDDYKTAIENSNAQELQTISDLQSLLDMAGIEIIASAAVKLYPVPVSDVLSIQADKVIGLVEIIDFTGKSIWNGHINALQAEIDFNNYLPGVYFIEITIGQESGIFRIIKQ